jgi:LysM repeat protein
MHKHKIPASITLAQGLLESGAGKSVLSASYNNHFGIKANADWKGDKVAMPTKEYRNGKLVTEQHWFRAYDKVQDSYTDHSLFLQRPRYQRLFELKITDYVAWAKGLQQCGYATDIAYANKLIKIIEDYELYRFDRAKRAKVETVLIPNRPIYKFHNLLYVLAADNDSFEQIAADLNISVRKLIKYNEVPEDFPLQAGDIVYLEKKKSKADKPYYEHTVSIGESMHHISQIYGMRIKSLYKLNKKDYEYVPVEGDVLRLR